MYGQSAGVAGASGAVGAVGAAATLPFTGLNLIWVLLAGFALIAAGTAIARMIPRKRA
jgi:hypothetical protein